jgi:hypothetical protein
MTETVHTKGCEGVGDDSVLTVGSATAWTSGWLSRAQLWHPLGAAERVVARAAPWASTPDPAAAAGPAPSARAPPG